MIYYEQGTTAAARQEVGVWTRELIDTALSLGGSFYLPYQLHATEAQFLRAYPRAPEFFALKRRVDPTNKFRNALWNKYYNAALQNVGAGSCKYFELLEEQNLKGHYFVPLASPYFDVFARKAVVADMTKKADWGTRGSGTPVGVAEVSPKRPHRAGAVGAAWARDPKSFDGQIYVVFAPQSQLNARYTVWGQVVSGMDVVEKLRIPDVIKRATVKQSAK